MLALLKGKARTQAKAAFLWLHRLAERLGVFITPATYYAPNASLYQLASTRATWARKSALPGIDIDVNDQLAFLKESCEPCLDEYMAGTLWREATQQNMGAGYGEASFAALYGMVRHLKPRRVVEVGSGVSTHAIRGAIQRNCKEGSSPCDLVCIEPNPYPGLKNSSAITLLAKTVQSIDIDRFLKLDTNDLLFIDSTHTVKPGGDVNYLILEVLPRLKPGVIVHFDDINLPFDYAPSALKHYYHWPETSLLRAFLINNHKVRILFCLRHLYVERHAELSRLLPGCGLPVIGEDGLYGDDVPAFDYPPGDRPGAIYLQIIG